VKILHSEGDSDKCDWKQISFWKKLKARSITLFRNMVTLHQCRHTCDLFRGENDLRRYNGTRT
jgi:hypothetical protein